MSRRKNGSRREILRLIAEGKLVQTGAIGHGRGLNVKAFAEEARSRNLITVGFSGHTGLYSWASGCAPKA